MEKNYKYETHLHTFPVSKCAKVSPRENLEFYKDLGYDGVFITNHFFDNRVNCDTEDAYQELIDYFFSDYEEAVKLGKEIGIKVFSGAEFPYYGTDFLVYGLEKEWYIKHSEIIRMKQSDKLAFLMESGALVIQAHPFREAGYIDHIRLFPRSVHGVEVVNTAMTDHVNEMAKIYARNYNLLEFAGSDNHIGKKKNLLAGMCCDSPILDEQDFVERVKGGAMQIFIMKNECSE